MFVSNVEDFAGLLDLGKTFESGRSVLTSLFLSIQPQPSSTFVSKFIFKREDNYCWIAGLNKK